VWFSIAGGRAQNAEPRRLLPMLCKAGNITRDDIGAIRIQQDESLVEIRESSLAGFLAAIGPDMRVEGGVVLTRVNPSAAGARDTRPPAVRAPAAKDTRPRAPIKREARPPAPPARAERAPAPATAAKEPRAAVKPKYQSAKPKAAAEAPQGTTSPFQWDDEPIVRPKKPKASVHAAAAKKPKKTGAYRSEAAGTLSVPKRKADGAAPKRSEGAGKPGKGPKPSFGKSAGKPTKAKARPTGKFSKGGSDAGGRGKK
jgi:ATP-dependent RNA helicase DeaD